MALESVIRSDANGANWVSLIRSIAMDANSSTINLEHVRLAKELMVSDIPVGLPPFGAANSILSVNAGGDGAVWTTNSFLNLSDTPETLTANQFLKVNDTGTGLEFATVSASNIGSSNLTISDNQRWLRLPNNLTTTKFSIQDWTGAEAFSVNGNSTVTLRTKVTGSTGFAVYCNNILVQLTNHTGTVFDRPIRTNSIQTEHSLLSGTGLSIGTGAGGSATMTYQPQNGYVTMSTHTSNSPIAPTIVNGFGLYPNTTGGVLHPSFVMSNGNQIHLRRADLPTNPTNSQIATFLSNLGLANLI